MVELVGEEVIGQENMVALEEDSKQLAGGVPPRKELASAPVQVRPFLA